VKGSVEELLLLFWRPAVPPDVLLLQANDPVQKRPHVLLRRQRRPQDQQ